MFLYVMLLVRVSFFFFNDTAPTEIYTLSLHDALPISGPGDPTALPARSQTRKRLRCSPATATASSLSRSEEHTSELQSRFDLVCRLLLEKKKTQSVWVTMNYTNRTRIALNIHLDQRKK